MNVLTKVFAVLVAAEFLYIFYLETVATDSKKTAKVFGMTVEELRQKNVNVLFKNQGVYNGLISVLILIAVFFISQSDCGYMSDAVYYSCCAIWQFYKQSEDHTDAGRNCGFDIDQLPALRQIRSCVA